jgi:hypothetical protein
MFTAVIRRQALLPLAASILSAAQIPIEDASEIRSSRRNPLPTARVVGVH